MIVSAHAVSRYRERVAPVSADEAYAALSNRRIKQAIDFGARSVKLPTGHRAVIENGTVVTVLPKVAGWKV